MTAKLRPTGKDKLRTRLQALYRECWSILSLVNGLTFPERESIRSSIDKVAELPRKELARLLPTMEEHVAQLRRQFAISTPGPALYALLTDKDRAGLTFGEWRGPLPVGKRTVFLSKYTLERIVPRYDLVLPNFPLLPPHAMIAIDLVGEYGPGETEVYTLEATLFEDMAALWNATDEGRRECDRLTPKPTIKRVLALNRATAKAAFGLLEGYMNGLAVDILSTNRVSDADKVLLKEWEASLKRPLGDHLKTGHQRSGQNRPPAERTRLVSV